MKLMLFIRKNKDTLFYEGNPGIGIEKLNYQIDSSYYCS